MQMKKKFKTRKEADKFCYNMLPVVTHIYKGHRGLVVQWNEEIKSPLNADGKPRMTVEELHNRIKSFGDSKISAVKLVRVELSCGLKEALDYCNKVWNGSN